MNDEARRQVELERAGFHIAFDHEGTGGACGGWFDATVRTTAGDLSIMGEVWSGRPIVEALTWPDDTDVSGGLDAFPALESEAMKTLRQKFTEAWARECRERRKAARAAKGWAWLEKADD